MEEIYRKKIIKYQKKIQTAGFDMNLTRASLFNKYINHSELSNINKELWYIKNDFDKGKHVSISNYYYIILASLFVDIQPYKNIVDRMFSKYDKVYIFDYANFRNSVTMDQIGIPDGVLRSEHERYKNIFLSTFPVTDSKNRKLYEGEMIKKIIRFAINNTDTLIIISSKYVTYSHDYSLFSKSVGDLMNKYSTHALHMPRAIHAAPKNIHNISAILDESGDKTTGEDDFIFWLIAIAFENVFEIKNATNLNYYVLDKCKSSTPSNRKRKAEHKEPQMLLITNDKQKLDDSSNGTSKNLFTELKNRRFNKITINEEINDSSFKYIINLFMKILFDSYNYIESVPSRHDPRQYIERTYAYRNEYIPEMYYNTYKHTQKNTEKDVGIASYVTRFCIDPYKKLEDYLNLKNYIEDINISDNEYCKLPFGKFSACMKFLQHIYFSCDTPDKNECSMNKYTIQKVYSCILDLNE